MDIRDWKNWAWKEPWADAMFHTPQSLPWHDENVWEHTKMVLEYLPQIEGWEDADQEALLWAGLLHDCAKPDTATWDDESNGWSFPKHSQKGEHKARLIMMDHGVDFHVREKACRLIRYHMKIRFVLEEKYPIDSLITLSHKVNIRSLCQLMYADQMGRNVEVEPPDIYMEIAKSLDEEYSILDQPFDYIDDTIRLLEMGKPYATPSEFTVTLMSGMPCSGKSTWAEKQGLPIVSLDAIRKFLKIKPTDRNGQGRVAQEAQEKCRELLRCKKEFIFDATNVTKRMRDKWIDLFMAYNARIRIVYVEVSPETIFTRNKGKASPIPEDAIKCLYNKLDVPDISECHEIHYEIGD